MSASKARQYLARSIFRVFERKPKTLPGRKCGVKMTVKRTTNNEQQVWVIRSELGLYAGRDPRQRWTNNLDNAWKWGSRHDAWVYGAKWQQDDGTPVVFAVIVPVLTCPECRIALLPAISLGRDYHEGERSGPWMAWLSDAEPVQCRCEAWVGVEIDDDCAYAVQVREPT